MALEIKKKSMISLLPNHIHEYLKTQKQKKI